MARLDRLQPNKDVAQTAACIGRDFSHQLLAKISPLSSLELSNALEELISAELIYRRGVAPDFHYQYKHALVRDVAYESLLKPRRRSIHAAILNTLRNDSDCSPEILATHAEAAGLIDEAIELWEISSNAAIERPALDEGIAHLSHAISLNTPRAEAGDKTALKKALAFQVNLSFSLGALRGWGAIETRTALDKAQTN